MCGRGEDAISIPDTGNHEQDQGGRSDHPGNVTGIVVDIEVLGERVTAGHGGAIVDLERDVGQRIETVRHVGGLVLA